MKVALENDAVLYQMVTTGCPGSHTTPLLPFNQFPESLQRLLRWLPAGTWPKGVQVGGFPGSIRYGLRPMAPQGTKKLLAELRAGCSAADAEKADTALLSEHLRNEMQKFYTELAEKNGTVHVKKDN